MFTKVMKSDKPDPKYPLRLPLYGSPKLDGIRCVVYEGRTYTTSNKEIPNRFTANWLSRLPNTDGELILGDPTDELVYNKTYSAVMAHDGEPDLTFYAFDIPLALPFEQRLDILFSLPLPGNVQIVPQKLLHSQEEVDEEYEQLVNLRYEGLMLRDPKGSYKAGRSTAREQYLLKMKPEEHAEAVILSAYEAMENTNPPYTDEAGRTKRSTDAAGLVPKGTLGGFVGRDILTGEEINIAPGKLKHDERLALWLSDRGVGRVCTYAHMGYGQKDAPRHARWHGWRNMEINP